MKKLLFIIALGVTACGPNPYHQETETKNTIQTSDVSTETSLEEKVKREELTVSYEYFLPNLEGERWFKVPDQYGCIWWINAGHKFDHAQIDVDEKTRKANCPNEKVAPDKEAVYRDRSGRVVDPYAY